MKTIKMYDWNSIFDFGKHKGEILKNVFDKEPNYLSWCFQVIDWFCITDNIFDNLPIQDLKDNKSTKKYYDELKEKHIQKKENFNSQNHNINENDDYNDNNYHTYSSDYNWLAETTGTDDPEMMNDVFWNID
jgi:hypothetical protein